MEGGVGWNGKGRSGWEGQLHPFTALTWTFVLSVTLIIIIFLCMPYLPVMIFLICFARLLPLYY